MTATLPAAWQRPAIVRSDDHRYLDTVTGIWQPGVTDIISCIGSSFDAASGFGARNTAQAAVRLIPELPKMLETLGPLGVEKALKAKASWGPDPSGNILGTAVHEAIERWLTEGGTWPLSTPVSTRLTHFQRWWEASGWRLRLTEAIVFHPPVTGNDGWGGTLDLLAYDQDGRTVLADVKTGRLWPRAVIQVAAYGMSTLIQPSGSLVTYPMPLPDRYVLIQVTETGCREVEVNVGTPERMAFLAALDIWHWQESMKGKRL